MFSAYLAARMSLRVLRLGFIGDGVGMVVHGSSLVLLGASRDFW